MMMKLTKEQIEAGRSPRGGWTKAQLAEWGVPWPPPKGWRRALVYGRPMPAPDGRPWKERDVSPVLVIQHPGAPHPPKIIYNGQPYEPVRQQEVKT
jgi:hypothetical protein